MKDSPTPPPPPDPGTTAAAQTQSNIQTALANARLNRVNQTTPFGSITYNTGDVDANGIPQYSANIQLSPQQQHLLDQQQQMQTLRNTIAQSLLGQTQSRLSQPLDLSHLHGMMDHGQLYGGAVNPAQQNQLQQMQQNPMQPAMGANLQSGQQVQLAGQQGQQGGNPALMAALQQLLTVNGGVGGK